MHTSPRLAAHYRSVCILSHFSLYGASNTPSARSQITAFINWKFFASYSAADLLAAYARFLLTPAGTQMFREVDALGGEVEAAELRETRREVLRLQKAGERERERERGRETARLFEEAREEVRECGGVGPWGAGRGRAGGGGRGMRKIWW